MLVDVILIAISIITIIVGIRNGFISSFMSFIAWLAATFCVLKFSLPFAEWVYTEFVRDSIIKKVSNTLQNDYDFGTAQSQFALFIVAISKFLSSVSSLTGADTSQNILNFDPSGMTLEQVSRNITDSYLAPIAIQFCKWIVSMVGFFALIAIFRAIGNVIVRAIRAMPLKSIDNLLGTLIGTLKAAVITIVASLMLHSYAGIAKSNAAVKNMQDDNVIKSSVFVQSIDESKIVKMINDKITF